MSRGLAVGDLFNDGRMDAVIENLVGTPMILRPEGRPAKSLDQFFSAREREGAIAWR